MVRPFGDVKEVGGHAAHKLTDLCVVKEIERESLKMIKHILSHGVFDFRTHPVTVVGLAVVSHTVQAPQGDIGGADSGNQLNGQTGGIAHSRIGNPSDNQRENYLACGRDGRADQHEQLGFEVLFEIGEKLFYKRKIASSGRTAFGRRKLCGFFTHSLLPLS